MSEGFVDQSRPGNAMLESPDGGVRKFR
jgi:hypothetical protein